MYFNGKGINFIPHITGCFINNRVFTALTVDLYQIYLLQPAGKDFDTSTLNCLPYFLLYDGLWY